MFFTTTNFFKHNTSEYTLPWTKHSIKWQFLKAGPLNKANFSFSFENTPQTKWYIK